MKSLKRTLCLVLALVMVLGLFGIASATNFTDDNTIQYKEAVDVMTGIGAINGMGDGTFNPKGTITRAQAAKLVTFAVLGEAGAKGLTGVTSSFSDVTVAGGFGWAIPSIEYLVREGVINGMGDGTFDPNGEISSTATLKMLLCALGYGKKGEYTGTGWDLKVTLDANKVGLTAGRTSTASVETPATREEVALYCLNTIQTQQVEYISTLDVYTKKEINVEGTDVPETIMNTVYGATNGNLTKDGVADGGKDPFDAPANQWTFKNKPIGAYAVKELVAYTSEQTLAKVAADLKGYTIDATVSANGTPAGGDNLETAAAIQELTGNGTVVKVYATGTTVDKVIQIKTDVAKVDLIDTAKKTVSISTVTDGVTAAETPFVIDSDHALYGTFSSLAENDYVLVTLADVADAGTKYNVVAASVPSQVTGRVTTVNVAQKSVTLNGTNPYGIAATTASSITAPDDATSSTVLWLDGYGYVVASKTTTAVTAKFAYILDTYTTLTGGKLVNMAKVVYTNGTTGDIAMSNELDDAVVTGAFVKLGTPSAAGVYTLTAPVAKDEENLGATPPKKSDEATADVGDEALIFRPVAADNALYVALTEDAEIKATDKRLTGEDDYVANFYADSVKFIFINTETKTATVMDGVQAVKAIPAGAVAILERHSAADDRGVVTAVILPGAKPSGAVDTSKLVYLPITAANGKANPVATTTLHDSSTDKDVKVPVFNAYVNGVQQAIPSKSTVEDQRYLEPGFYTMSPVPTVTGQYELNEYDDENEDVKQVIGATITEDDAFDTILTVAVDTNVKIDGATVVDVRAADVQTAAPITPTAKGLVAALRSYDLDISVLYNEKAGTASVIYINGADAKQEPAATISLTLTPSGGQLNKETGADGWKSGQEAKVVAEGTLSEGEGEITYSWTYKVGDNGAEQTATGATLNITWAAGMTADAVINITCVASCATEGVDDVTETTTITVTAFSA